ncbi:RNB domain-containing ribonuclease [Candidatus Venteria ishoeyi]|uniref:ribonuclease catalytic domain-containing protein n=2 Tax=Candidatus Venteria ishoeyi TaxID=1899563 RepID=UPI0025A4E3EB|nr:RNB domain-containing ribonuclease [Candidatus Venteria ishoeyi]MDM8547400.1 RNB domain-containing ribonuclease [Candidatus Venteria ishoeyi]
MSEWDGRVWVIQNNDDLALICQVKTIKKKIQCLNEKFREHSLPENKLFWLLGAKVRNATEWPEVLSGIQGRLAGLRDEIDVPLLWETAQELETSDLDELAELYFGEDTGVEHKIAIWQALAVDALHFKRKGKEWEIRNQQQIEELRTQREREQERIRTATIARECLTRASKAKASVDISEDEHPFIERLENWMRGDRDKDIETLITEIASSVRLPPRELIFEVLQKVGRIPADADRDVIIAGLRADFSEPVQEAALAVAPWVPAPAQEIQALAFSIDDEDTREVDDALNIVAHAQGWTVTIGIADPAAIIAKGDTLDKEAMRRGTTVYLPTQTILMIPPRVSTDLSSLTAQTPRSSVLIQVELDLQYQVQDFSIRRAAVLLEQRLSYAQADALLADGSDEMAEKLQALQQVTDALRQQRMDNGALSFNRPEYKMQVTDGQVAVKMIERNSPSRDLVAELMILANHLAGKYAQQHEVPLIFRTQDAPVEPIDRSLLQDPMAFLKLRKLLKPSALSLQPGAHSGLGLSVYTQFSSPLRRFADLVMQRQLDAHLNGETLPYDQEELFKVLATADSTAREAKFLEMDSKKRWFVMYLKQQWSDKNLIVRVLEPLKAGYKVELLPWGVEALLSSRGISGDALEPGKLIMTKIEKLRQKAGQIRLQFVSQEADLSLLEGL